MLQNPSFNFFWQAETNMLSHFFIHWGHNNIFFHLKLSFLQPLKIVAYYIGTLCNRTPGSPDKVFDRLGAQT